MEPITHLMTGACLARAGFNRKAAYATLAMTLAAEAPDLDTLWSVRGPIASFQHHRGITHTFLGLPFEAAIVLGIVYLIHRLRLCRAKPAPEPGAPSKRPDRLGGLSFAEANDRPSSSPPTSSTRSPANLTTAPIRWPLLYAFTLIALLSHILLDWTNNYGVRPFFPFNPRWYAGSIVFIFEPFLFAILLLALVAPALFGLIGSEVGARRPAFRGRGFALFAIAAMLVLWGWRQIERDNALRLAYAAPFGPGHGLPAQVLRLTASPYPINPYRWHIVAETPNFYQLATADTLHATFDTDPTQDIFFKPPTTLATLVAKRTYLGQVYLDWSTWPLVTDTDPTSPAPNASIQQPITAVTFRDLRFLYDTILLSGRRNPPISGTVYLDLAAPDRDRIVRMEMNGNPQR